MRSLLTSMRFMILWILGSVVALYATLTAALIIGFASSIIAAFIWTTSRGEPGATQVLIFSLIVYSLIGLVMGLIIGSIQRGLLYQKTGDDWRGWIVASMIGSILAINATGLLVGKQIVTLVTTLTLPPREMLILLAVQVFIVPLVCLSLIQATVLSRFVRGAWVWILANGVAGIVMFSLIISTVGGGPLAALTLIGTILIVSAAPGIVTGFAMIWLIHFNWKHHYPGF